METALVSGLNFKPVGPFLAGRLSEVISGVDRREKEEVTEVKRFLTPAKKQSKTKKGREKMEKYKTGQCQARSKLFVSCCSYRQKNKTSAAQLLQASV